jgi:hypothetical protein
MQASDVHIAQALQTLQALAVPTATGVRWCLLDRCTQADALETLLLTCLEHSQPLDQVDADALLTHLAASPDIFSCASSPMLHCVDPYYKGMRRTQVLDAKVCEPHEHRS